MFNVSGLVINEKYSKVDSNRVVYTSNLYFSSNTSIAACRKALEEPVLLSMSSGGFFKI